MFQKLRINSIPRAKGITDRLVAVALSGRFMDELLSGLPNVIMPLIRSQLRLSYAQVSMFGLTLDYVSAPVEFISGLLIDLWKRPWLMAWGAAAIGIGTAVIGVAPTFIVLLLGFAIYALGSGPLVHTADVVLVESYPEAPDRIYSRATLIDTTGALLAPIILTAGFWLGISWRWLTIALGSAGLFYAAIIVRTKFPPSPLGSNMRASDWSVGSKANLKAVLTNRRALTWLMFLFVFGMTEAPIQFITIFLREEAGFSQILIGVYVAFQMGVSIVSLAVLDQWLVRSGYRRILITASCILLILYPIWLLVPNLSARFLLAIPINYLFTVYWPIARAQSLASVSGRAGTVTAVNSVFALVPLPLLFGLLAEWITLTLAMLLVTWGSILILLVIAWLMPDRYASSGKAADKSSLDD